MTDEPGAPEPRTRRWLRFRLGYVFILAAVVLFSIKFGSRAWDTHRLALQVAAVGAQLQQENQDNQMLARQIQQYKTLSFVKQQARAWGYVNAGDRPVIVSYTYLRPAPIHRPVHRQPAAPTWQLWWNVFFGGH